MSSTDSSLEEKRHRARELLRRRAASAPASFAQERLWFLDQIAPARAVYNMPCALRLEGALDPSLLERVLHEIVRRHASLRARFASRGGQLYQEIADQPAPLAVVDLAHLDEAALLRRAAEEAARPFDLASGPLLRAALLRRSAEDHVLICTMHHTVSDGWSIALLLRELGALYRAFHRGEPSPLAPIALSYADYAAWQRRRLASGELDAQLSYWRTQLGGAPPALDLPTDRPRPAAQSFRGAVARVAISPALGRALRELARAEGATLYMVLLAAFQCLLHRHSAQEDLVVGVPIAGRNRTELEELIGLFVNTLALRVELSPAMTFRELLARVRATTLEAHANQDLPFERLVEELAPSRDLGRAPLVQVMFVLLEPLGELALPGLRASPVPLDTGTAKFDLTLSLTDEPGGLVGTLEYSTDLFDPPTIARLIDRFQVLLAGIAADPGAALARLPLSTGADPAASGLEPASAADLALVRLLAGDARAGAAIAVVGPDLEPVPDGLAGELVVGEAGLPRAAWSRTGALVRRRATGELGYLGRADAPVRIHGHRVDPGEVERLLLAHPAIAEAAVVARRDPPAHRLVAHVVHAGEAVTAADLRAHLARWLPPAMIPAAFVALDALPRAADGAIDRAALPAGVEPRPAGASQAPETPLQQAVARAWSQILGLDSIGVHDDFFESGGTSLNLAALAFRIQEIAGVEVPVRALYQAPTIAQQVLLLERGAAEAGAPAPIARRPGGPVPVSYGQERIWRWQAVAPDCTAYHIPIALGIAGELDLAALGRALDRIAARHEVLRSVYREVDGQLVQTIAPAAPAALPVVYIAGLPEPERTRAALARAQEEVQRRFDLERGPPMRALVLRLGEAEHVLVVVWHHIVADNRAVLVFLRELAILFEAERTGAPAALPDLPFQYGDYAHWQRSRMSGANLEQLLAYWEPRLRGARPFEMRTDHALTAAQEAPLASFACDARSWTVPAPTCEGLGDIARAGGVTLSVAVMASLFAWLDRYSAHRDIAITGSYHGHDHPGTEQLFGYFARPLVLRADLSDDPTFAALVERMKDVLYGAFAHAELQLFEVAGAPVELISRMHVVYQNADPPAPAGRFGPWFPLSTGRFRSRYMFLGAVEQGGSVTLSIRYNVAAFRAETVERMLRDYAALLDRIVGAPERRLSELTPAAAR